VQKYNFFLIDQIYLGLFFKIVQIHIDVYQIKKKTIMIYVTIVMNKLDRNVRKVFSQQALRKESILKTLLSSAIPRNRSTIK